MDGASFDFSDLVKVVRTFSTQVVDLAPSMQLIADALVGDVKDEWDSAGQGSWPPYAPSTLVSKGSEGGLRMLFETGEAYDSLEPSFGTDFAAASSDVGHLVFHLGDEPRTKIPKRDPFKIYEERVDKAAEVILEAIAGGKR